MNLNRKRLWSQKARSRGKCLTNHGVLVQWRRALCFVAIGPEESLKTHFCYACWSQCIALVQSQAGICRCSRHSGHSRVSRGADVLGTAAEQATSTAVSPKHAQRPNVPCFCYTLSSKHTALQGEINYQATNSSKRSKSSALIRCQRPGKLIIVTFRPSDFNIACSCGMRQASWVMS